MFSRKLAKAAFVRGRNWIALVALSVLGGCDRVKPAAPPPNILIMVVDTLRADHLGCYGFRGDISPAMDALAAESVLFSRCYAAAPWTRPSVASLFTSVNPLTHGVMNSGPGKDRIREMVLENKGKLDQKTEGVIDTWFKVTNASLPPSFPTLAAELTGSGFRSAAFIAGNPMVSRESGLLRGFDTVAYRTAETRPDGKPHPLATDLGDDAVEWLRSGDQRKPFFVYLHFMDVHNPYSHPDEKSNRAAYDLAKTFRSVGPSRPLPSPEPAAMKREFDAIFSDAPSDRRDLRNLRAKYAAGIFQFDRQLDTILKRLRSGGHLENTVIVFTSDHGEEFFERGRWQHGKTLYNEMLHVPLLLRLPGGKHAGGKIHSVVSGVDIMPTLLSLAGREWKHLNLQGRDMGPLLASEATPDPEWSYAAALEAYPYRASAQNGRHKIIIDLKKDAPHFARFVPPAFKWEFPPGQTFQLFDLIQDPGEQHDLSAAHPDAPDSLMSAPVARLRAFLAQRPIEGLTGEPLSGEQKEQLRSLGYLQ